MERGIKKKYELRWKRICVDVCVFFFLIKRICVYMNIITQYQFKRIIEFLSFFNYINIKITVKNLGIGRSRESE